MIHNIPNLPEQKQALLEELVKQLSKITGAVAIVLGGSYASGTHHEASDMDIGVYYFESNPFSIDEIRNIANDAAVDGKATVTGFYEWGAWVNGGAWIHTSQGKVDFLYRNLDQVRRTIAEAQQGIYRHDYDQQPTYGFYSMIYLAETQICVPLYDPELLIAKLKHSMEVYSPKLKQKIIIVATFLLLPPDYIPEINRILACPGRTPQELTTAVNDLEQAWRINSANILFWLLGIDYNHSILKCLLSL